MQARDRAGVARILVVEDERVVARDLATVLGDLGYDVVGIVGSGEEAIAKTRELHPDLVLMDIRLAGHIDGVETSTVIRKDHDIPIIYLTAHSDSETLQRATTTAPYAYLVKPFHSVDLRCSIEVSLHRHEIEARLREREQWLVTTLRSIGDGVVATDPDTKVRFLNPVAEALTGWRHEEAIGNTLAQIVTIIEQPSSDPDQPSVGRSAREGATTNGQRSGSLVDRAGGLIPIDHIAAPIRDDRGGIRGEVMVFRDVTEQHRTEAEIRRLNAELEHRVLERTQQLEAANEELEAFSYSVAHDLRAPLRGIEGFSQMLVEDHVANLVPEALAKLDRVRASARRMRQLIDDLLCLAHAARIAVAPRSVDLSQLANALAVELRGADPGRQVDLRIQPDVRVQGDEHLLRILLENLLQNAWKYTSKTNHAVIEFGEQDRDGTPVCFVRDNGAGFDMTHAAQLFGAFQRFHPASEFEGTGVGLAIVQRIINRHRGRVWAEGEVGRGATFYFVLSGVDG